MKQNKKENIHKRNTSPTKELREMNVRVEENTRFIRTVYMTTSCLCTKMILQFVCVSNAGFHNYKFSVRHDFCCCCCCLLFHIVREKKK